MPCGMTATRAGLAALALSTLLPFLSPRPFFSPDEAFYAQVAREMAETGDYVVPRFDGQPWLEKPPLVAWLLSGRSRCWAGASRPQRC